MTEKEAIKVLKRINEESIRNDIVQATSLGIKALEQQPCDDAISREAFIKRYDEWMYSEYGKHCEKDALAIRVASSLSPATPSRRKGHWARQTDDYHDYYECEYCGIAVGIDDIKHFCPNCGADMRGDDAPTILEATKGEG